MTAADDAASGAYVDFRRKGLLEPVGAEARESAMVDFYGITVMRYRVYERTLLFKYLELSGDNAHGRVVGVQMEQSFSSQASKAATVEFN